VYLLDARDIIIVSKGSPGGKGTPCASPECWLGSPRPWLPEVHSEPTRALPQLGRIIARRVLGQRRRSGREAELQPGPDRVAAMVGAEGDSCAVGLNKVKLGRV